MRVVLVVLSLLVVASCNDDPIYFGAFDTTASGDTSGGDVGGSDGSGTDVPTPDAGDSDAPTRDADDSDAPTRDADDSDVPTLDAGDADAPTPDSGDADAPTPDSGGGLVTVDACMNAADLAIVTSRDVTGEAQDCGLGCLGSDDPQQCSAECVVDATGLSASCAGCYGSTVFCTIENCLAACAVDPSSAACLDCQEENCLAAFNVCAGVLP